MAEIVGDPEKISEVYRKDSDQSSHSGHSEDLGHFPLKEARIGDSIDSGLDESVKGLESQVSQISKVSHEDEHCKKKRKNMVVPAMASLDNVDDAVIDNMVQFREKQHIAGTVDIYWLYDDGGLTLLIPHILLTRAKYQKCRLRVFFLCSRKDELDKETMNMATLLAKFRIETDDVIIIPDATKKPTSESKEAFEKLVTAGSRSQKTSSTSMTSDMSSSSLEENKFIIPEEVLLAHKDKTNFHLRIAEVVREHSRDASLVVMTLPMVRKQQVPSQLYLAWLDTLTANMPPTLLVRGNQASVLTFYS